VVRGVAAAQSCRAITIIIVTFIITVGVLFAVSEIWLVRRARQEQPVYDAPRLVLALLPRLERRVQRQGNHPRELGALLLAAMLMVTLAAAMVSIIQDAAGSRSIPGTARAGRFDGVLERDFALVVLHDERSRERVHQTGNRLERMAVDYRQVKGKPTPDRFRWRVLLLPRRALVFRLQLQAFPQAPRGQRLLLVSIRRWENRRSVFPLLTILVSTGGQGHTSSRWAGPDQQNDHVRRSVRCFQQEQQRSPSPCVHREQAVKRLLVLDPLAGLSPLPDEPR
jgi:F0F1-type ATP synthase membrane subunit c/vacuolar-type H+-ATPase subunit K